MIQELIYTSAVKGVRPGSSGYCTVAHTRGMNPAMIRMLESLSAYSGNNNGSLRTADAPTAIISHWRVITGHETVSILSSVTAVEGEHTGRDNKLAHHFVFSAGDRPMCGPAKIAEQSIFENQWRKAPTLLEPRHSSAMDNLASDTDSDNYGGNWEQLTGDAGWAGYPVHCFNQNDKRPLYLVYETGMNILPLIRESLNLIPPAKRWLVSFSTWFVSSPAGVSCLWRGCPAAAWQPQERNSSFNTALILDLTKPLGEPPPCREVQAARGEAPPPPTPAANRKTSLQSKAGDTVKVQNTTEKPKLRLRR